MFHIQSLTLYFTLGLNFLYFQIQVLDGLETYGHLLCRGCIKVEQPIGGRLRNDHRYYL